MAHELRIRKSDGLVKIRNPWAVSLLPFVTFGIYHLVWWYRINRELCDFGYANDVDLGTSPALSTLALFPGGLIIVPARERGYLSMPRAADVQAAVTSRMNFACVVASEEIHSTSLLPGPRSSELAIALSAFS